MDLYDLKHFRFFYKYHEKVNPKYIIYFFFLLEQGSSS